MSGEFIIHKQELRLNAETVNDPIELKVPKGSVFCSAQNQTALSDNIMAVFGPISIWYRFPAENMDDLECREIMFIETGKRVYLGEAHLYLGTILLAGGAYVVHAFERGRSSNEKAL